MATVVSLTEDKIRELLSGWEGFSLTQDEINALVLQLKTQVDTDRFLLEDFNTNVRPQLEADIAAGSIRVSELNDVILPDLQANLDQAALDIENIQTVDIPALQGGLANEIQNSLDRPKVYRQPDEPTNPDADDRYLVVGDTWFDEDDNDLLRVWDGAAWSTFQIDIPDLSLTVRKFNTSTHMIY